MSKKTESEYRWYKKIDKPHTNKNFIQDQIDSFMFYVENEEYVDLNKYKDELLEFCDLILNRDHLNKLDEDYQDRFNELNKFIKEKISIRTIKH